MACRLLGRAHGHIGGLFVPRLNGRQVIGVVEQGIEKPVILHAGEAIQCVDPVSINA